MTHLLRCGKLHGLEAGPSDGPLVILLHGFPDFSWGWHKQIPALAAAGFHVVAPDQRGYAHSDKPLAVRDYRIDELAADVLRLAEACEAQSFRLVGHDWGGIIAWWVAARHPQSVEQLVVINAPHPDAWSRLVRRRWSQAWKSWYVAFFQLSWLPEFLLSFRNFSLLRRALCRSSRPGTFSTGDLEDYVAAWSQPGALTAMLNYYRALRLRPREPLPRISPATLLLWGEQDHFLERALADASLTFCSEAQSQFFPDATHWLHLEEPDYVNAAVLAFFQNKRSLRHEG